MSALTADFIRALDPVALAETTGISADPWQADVLRSTHPSIMLNCTRQGGKSSVSSVLGVHAAQYEPGSPVLLLSPSQRQSGELFKKCLAVYASVGRARSEPESENTSVLELENGSRIISLPGTSATVRSFSAVRLVIVDEASRVSDELIAAIRPMLAVSGGRIVTLSTPYGKRGWWWDAWENGGPGIKRVRITADDCPRIGQHYPGGKEAFLAAERLALGERAFRQEYYCEFAETTDQVFSEEIVKKAFSREVEALKVEI